jgi:hypothetical protein
MTATDHTAIGESLELNLGLGHDVLALRSEMETIEWLRTRVGPSELRQLGRMGFSHPHGADAESATLRGLARALMDGRTSPLGIMGGSTPAVAGTPAEPPPSGTPLQSLAEVPDELRAQGSIEVPWCPLDVHSVIEVDAEAPPELRDGTAGGGA